MDASFRFVVFLTTVLTLWTGMHVYVFWRLLSLPWLKARPRLPLLCGVMVLWASYIVSRMLVTRWPTLALVFEAVGAVWMGVLFLLLVCLWASELLTGFGLWLKAWLPLIRGLAVGVALVLSLVAVIQAARPPRTVHVNFPGLSRPEAVQGQRWLLLSDLHVGGLLRQAWLTRLAEQVETLKPDGIFLAGDLWDDAERAKPLLPIFARLQAPLGTYAVSGNHEFYAGLQASLELMQQAGFTVLQDSSHEVMPGLRLVGVDDLTARQQKGEGGISLSQVIDQPYQGLTVLLSHSPWQVAEAAALGVNIMLSGHTHDGQIWPFRYFVRLRYPYIHGHYQIQQMHLFVTRGTGFWGPPLRLFRRGEIVVIDF